MIEKNILEWLEVGDSIQKLDVYNNKIPYSSGYRPPYYKPPSFFFADNQLASPKIA